MSRSASSNFMETSATDLSCTLTDTGFELVILRVASVYIEFWCFLIARNLIVLGQESVLISALPSRAT